jgi:hypothetical protein
MIKASRRAPMAPTAHRTTYLSRPAVTPPRRHPAPPSPRPAATPLTAIPPRRHPAHRRHPAPRPSPPRRHPSPPPPRPATIPAPTAIPARRHPAQRPSRPAGAAMSATHQSRRSTLAWAAHQPLQASPRPRGAGGEPATDMLVPRPATSRPRPPLDKDQKLDQVVEGARLGAHPVPDRGGPDGHLTGPARTSPRRTINPEINTAPGRHINRLRLPGRPSFTGWAACDRREKHSRQGPGGPHVPQGRHTAQASATGRRSRPTRAATSHERAAAARRPRWCDGAHLSANEPAPSAENGARKAPARTPRPPRTFPGRSRLPS